MAEIVPLPQRPQSMSWARFEQEFLSARADPGLATDLAELVPDSTDDVPLP